MSVEQDVPVGDADALTAFQEPVRRWFRAALGEPSEIQRLAWPLIASGEHVLMVAPTGSGKTLAAFLWMLDRLIYTPAPRPTERCRLLYISPLKALAADIERNLQRPLEGILEVSRTLGHASRRPEVALRTGDTPSRERRRFLRQPADILITTPESLYLLLTSVARETLRSIRWVIVDEVHAVVSSKRGSHLALSLERLEELVRAEGATLQRIGLSATANPVDEIARFLGGFEDDGSPRRVRIAQASDVRRFVVHVHAPERSGFSRPDTPASGSPVWPAMRETVLRNIRSHRSTLIFVNNRRLAERLAADLNDLAGSEIARAHHGSLARERRLQIEEDLKAGRLPALVATSSLELGIDMGAIDLVIQIEAPPSIASAIQRIGRSGHRVGEVSEGIILPKHRGDLLACAAAAGLIQEGAVEPMRYPRNPLDVLAQQIVAAVAMDPMTVDRIERLVRRAAPFHDLPRALLEDVLEMLSGRYPSHEFRDLRPRLFWDRTAGTLTARESARRVAVLSAGTIPDRGQYGVFLAGVPPSQGRVGELEEIMVFESRVGDVFVLGASSWRIVEITDDRVLVEPAPGSLGRMPFWHGDAAGRPVAFGRAIGRLVRTLLPLNEADARALLTERHGLSEAAALDLLDFLRAQRQAVDVLPDDRTIVVERHRDEMGEWRICILAPLGSRVLAPWAMAIACRVRQRTGAEMDTLWTEDGIILRFPDADAPPPLEWLIPDADEVRELVMQQLGLGGGAARRISHGAPVTALFASRFREAAARALLLPGGGPGKRSPLWLTRKRAADLLQIVGRFPDFPIVLETFRECLQDVFDMDALVDLLRDVAWGTVRVAVCDTTAPSPMAASLLFSYMANFMYEGDAPLAERRVQALAIDAARLRQLLGEADVRDLLDPSVLRETEERLQAMPATSRLSPDGVHDLLLRLGDLTTTEIAGRFRADDNTVSAGGVEAVLRKLLETRRVLRVIVGGHERWIAAEDAPVYRDAVGCALPADFDQGSERGEDPLRYLIGRYAATHGPFTEADVARRLGIGPAVVRKVLTELEAGGRVLQGEFAPDRPCPQWCDAGVLKMLRLRSLARLRREVEPVDRTVYARYLLDRHGVTSARDPTGGAADLVDAIALLQGYPLPASDLESRVLPARLPAYDPRDLDLLMATGEALWVGDGRLGAHDGRIRLLLPGDAAELLPQGSRTDPDAPGHSDMQRRMLAFLEDAGPSTFSMIVAAVGGFPGEILDALWELVWHGLVSSDTFRPVRALTNRQAARRAETYIARRGGHIRRPAAGYGASPPALPTAVGRWFSVRAMLQSMGAFETARGADATARAAAWAQQLLDRYGVVTREAVNNEPVLGGFAGLYPVFKAMEESGRIRRGHFVEGLGASQFAVPDAVERLRSLREESRNGAPVLLAASDPANPYGSVLPWPDCGTARRPERVAGCCVVLQNGELLAWISQEERRLLVFREDKGEAALLVRTLADALRSGMLEPLVIGSVNGMPAGAWPSVSVFHEHGFDVSTRGIVLRRPSRL